MIMNNNKNWFNEDYGFFGDFYYIADNSREGAFRKYNETREQRTEREIQIISELLQTKEGDSLFDWPCGWGRHSLRLAQHGLNITAMDTNQKYLSMLQGSLEKETEIVRNRVHVLNCDLRQLPAEQKLHDFGINMFSSFGFFDDEENLQVLKNFYSMLKSHGKMLIHLDFNAQRLIEGIGDDYASDRTISYNGLEYRLKVEKHYFADDKRLHGRWVLIDEIGNEIEKKYSFRIYDEIEMKNMLLEAGFKVIFFYSTNLQKLSNNSLDTVIIACK